MGDNGKDPLQNLVQTSEELAKTFSEKHPGGVALFYLLDQHGNVYTRWIGHPINVLGLREYCDNLLANRILPQPIPPAPQGESNIIEASFVPPRRRL